MSILCIPSTSDTSNLLIFIPLSITPLSAKAFNTFSGVSSFIFTISAVKAVASSLL